MFKYPVCNFFYFFSGNFENHLKPSVNLTKIELNGTRSISYISILDENQTNQPLTKQVSVTNYGVIRNVMSDSTHLLLKSTTRLAKCNRAIFSMYLCTPSTR